MKKGQIKVDLHKFNSYEEYQDRQIRGFREKLEAHGDGLFSGNDAIIEALLVSYIFDYNPTVSFGLCHGSRFGHEQESFIKAFKTKGSAVEVLGTEIAPEAAEKYPNTIAWDFHEVKKEWLNNVDFIYSNSFDHSCKPKECLDAWMSCLNDNGLCIIEWQDGDDNITSGGIDPFGASLEEYASLFREKYYLIDRIHCDVDKVGEDSVGRICFVLSKNAPPKNFSPKMITLDVNSDGCNTVTGQWTGQVVYDKKNPEKGHWVHQF